MKTTLTIELDDKFLPQPSVEKFIQNIETVIGGFGRGITMEVDQQSAWVAGYGIPGKKFQTEKFEDYQEALSYLSEVLRHKVGPEGTSVGFERLREQAGRAPESFWFEAKGRAWFVTLEETP